MSLATLCSWFGITRQAFYQHKKRVEQVLIGDGLILDMVREIRLKHPKMGGRKLYYLLKPKLLRLNINMGRDKFFDLLRSNYLLIRKRRGCHITTDSNHWMRKYPNLIKDVIPLGPNHILVSDITYWKSQDKYYYISLITDAYSKKILGANVADNMEAVESVKALKEALKHVDARATGIIHHSDRGSQYCSAEYVKVLKKRGIAISMTDNGDPLENAIAERVNGIIKDEYLFQYNVSTLSEAEKILAEVVKLYNEERPHTSLNNMTPAIVYSGLEDREIKRLWQNYYSQKTKNYSDEFS